MALPSKTLDEIASLRTAAERYDYFCQNARYMPDAPRLRYMIRVGTETLKSDDTYELRLEFDKAVKRLRRRRLK